MMTVDYQVRVAMSDGTDHPSHLLLPVIPETAE